MQRTKQLVADIRLRRVHWSTVMPHVLGRMKGVESQAIEEVTGVQKASNRPNLPSCFLPAQQQLVRKC